MHSQDIIHRDIKPENILVVPEEKSKGQLINVKLTDFGFACYFDPKEGLTTFCGSPFYMAPEITRKESYGKPVDIWAVGCLAYNLIAGDYPFYYDGEDKDELFKMIQNDEPDFAGLKDELSPLSVKFVEKCLKKDPAQRPTADELLNDPWILNQAEDHIVSDATQLRICNDLRRFHKQSLFFQGINSIMADLRVQQAELKELKQMFLQMDKDQNGILTKEEVREGVQNVFSGEDPDDWD